jgi:ankyrin repeat protein
MRCTGLALFFILTNLLFVVCQTAEMQSKDPNLEALISSIEGHDLERFKAILKKSPVVVNLKGFRGRTPLHFAVVQKQTEMSQLLLQNKADVNAQDEEGKTPLHWVNDVEVAKLLIDHKADVNARGKTGRTPLHEAAHGNIEIAKFLLANKADVNATEKSISTPLHQAVFSKKPAVMKILLDNKADINAKNIDGDTPLHKAASQGVEEVKMLLAYKADINAANNYGWTPLFRAIAFGNSVIAELLVTAKPDLTHKNKDGETALDFAKRFKDQKIITVLLANGAK